MQTGLKNRVKTAFDWGRLVNGARLIAEGPCRQAEINRRRPDRSDACRVWAKCLQLNKLQMSCIRHVLRTSHHVPAKRFFALFGWSAVGCNARLTGLWDTVRPSLKSHPGERLFIKLSANLLNMSIAFKEISLEALSRPTPLLFSESAPDEESLEPCVGTLERGQACSERAAPATLS